jgi:hypothetical protein
MLWRIDRSKSVHCAKDILLLPGNLEQVFVMCNPPIISFTGSVLRVVTLVVPAVNVIEKWLLLANMIPPDCFM